MITAEILATGDEIRTGALVDSNSAYLADLLERNGVAVTRHHSVGDELGALSAVIEEIGGRADIAVVTGGLGPTVDDRSTEAAAKVAGAALELDSRALDDIKLFFAKRGRPYSSSNQKQAMIPKGGTTLYNPIGTAPGFSLKIDRCTFFFLPGVPHEMKRMFEKQVLPMIETLRGPTRQYSLVRTLSTFGLTESMVGERMKGIARDFPKIILGLRAKFPEIQVKLYLRTGDQAQGDDTLDRAGQWVEDRLGDHLFSRAGRSMADELGRLLIETGASLSVAESCTGGLIGNWLTNCAGSSTYFKLSAVTYHNQAKIDLLGVKEQTLVSHGAVHEETAREMAAGARERGCSTYGLSTTGIAGPDGGTDDKPVGTICIGLATPEKIHARRFQFNFGRRLMNKRIFAMTALDMLRRELVQAEPMP